MNSRNVLSLPSSAYRLTASFVRIDAASARCSSASQPWKGIRSSLAYPVGSLVSQRHMATGSLWSSSSLNTLASTAQHTPISQFCQDDSTASLLPQLSILAPSVQEPNLETAEATATSLTTAQTVAESAAETFLAFHSTVSAEGTLFPWGVSLILSAISLRLLTLPLVYYNQIHMGRAALASKELPRIQAFVRQTPGSLLQKYLTFRRLRSLTFRSAGTSDIKRFRWHILLHVPLVVSASMGIRRVAETMPTDWANGGLGWFTDLTAADPTGALPLMTTALWIWNVDPRSVGSRKDAGKSIKADGSNSKKNAAIERIMSNTGEWFTTTLQMLAVASLAVTKDMPAGMLLFWASNGVVTAVQRALLTNDTVRRQAGLLTKEDLERMTGPPVLQSVGTAVQGVRKELEYVQRELLSVFEKRRVDEDLVKDVNRALKRERGSGRISMQLRAVMRKDDRDGRAYIAVVREGTE